MVLCEFASQDLRSTSDDCPSMQRSQCICGYRTAILFTDALHAVLDPHGKIHQAPEMVQLPIVLVSDGHGSKN